FPGCVRTAEGQPTLPGLGGAQCQTLRMTHPVRPRRNPGLQLYSKRVGPIRPTRESFASSSLTAVTTWTSPTSSLRRLILAALNVSSIVKASPVAKPGNDASATDQRGRHCHFRSLAEFGAV